MNDIQVYKYTQINFYFISILYSHKNLIAVQWFCKRIGAAMIIVLASSALNCGFEIWSSKTKDL
jgi:hypothetical protein